jgi:putative ABC transport system substrate-binding protein
VQVTADLLDRLSEGVGSGLGDLNEPYVQQRNASIGSSNRRTFQEAGDEGSAKWVRNRDDPVTYGFVASLPHPGGNLTGLSMVNTELSSKRIELLKEIAPGITRIAVFTDPTMGPQGLPETAAAARALGLELQVLELTGAAIEHGFAEAERGRAQALLVMPTPFYNLPDVRGRIGRLALQYRLPSMCEEVSYVRDGCLLSYGPDFTTMWHRSAIYVLKILQGAKPAELPVEQPTKFNFFINLNTAKALGLTVPPILLAMADEVIE